MQPQASAFAVCRSSLRISHKYGAGLRPASGGWKPAPLGRVLESRHHTVISDKVWLSAATPWLLQSKDSCDRGPHAADRATTTPGDRPGRAVDVRKRMDRRLRWK